MSYIRGSGVIVTEIAGQEMVIRGMGSELLDEDVTFDDYGCGNGGYIEHVPGEWDWFLEMDWRQHDHGLTCGCRKCKTYWKPVKDEARKWLRKNSVFSPKTEDLAIGIVKHRELSVVMPETNNRRMTNAEIDRQIKLLERMKQDNDLQTA